MSKLKKTSQDSKIIITLFIIFFASFLIRLISLSQSLWLDEATTARVIQQYNFLEIITKFSPTDFHPPLYYLFMKVWTNVFGYSEIVLRFPSVIFSLLTGYVVYIIGKLVINDDSGRPRDKLGVARMTKEQTGFWAAVFFLFNPLIVYYSQEARMYMMVTFLLTVTLYYFIIVCHAELVSASDSKSRSRNKFGMTKALFLFNVFISLAFVTFYGSIFLIIPMLIYLLYKKKYFYFFTSCFLLFTTIFLLTPLLYQQFINAKQQLQLVTNWGQVLGKANLKNLLLIPLKFSVGRISFNPKWLYWGISGFWALIVWFFILKSVLKNRLLLFLSSSSLIFGILFSFFTPLLQYFRFLYLVPFISIFIALETSSLHLKGAKWVVVIGFLLWSLLYLLNPNFHREDWISLAKSLPYDKVYMIYSSSDAITYYRSDIKIVDLKSIVDSKIMEPEIIIIPYTSDIHRIDYQKILSRKKYKLKKRKVFRGLSIETWKYYNSM